VIVLGPDIRPDRRHYRPEVPAPRTQVNYRCARGHDFTVMLAAGAEQPQSWDCRCGSPAGPRGEQHGDARGEQHGDARGRLRRTVLGRRTPAEREAALAERLAEVAAMRKAGHL
jgi:hypothetical protein